MAFLGEMIAGTVGSVANGLVNNYFSKKSMEDQTEQQLKATDYLYGKYLSPQAQARNYANAGFNPAQALSNGNISSLNPSAPMPQAPVYSTGLENLTQLSEYYKALADAKKAGVDTLVAEEDAKLKAIQNKREDFELYLRKKFGLSKTASEVALAYENVLLAKQQGQINEVEKAIKEWSKAKEKALAESEGVRKKILDKEFANTDKRISLENRVLETQGTANVASANASNAAAHLSGEQATTESEMRDLRKTAQTLSNGLSALNYDLDSKTLSIKVEELANRVGVLKWNALMSELQYKDESTYNAVQRLLRGNHQSGDIGQILKALKNYEEFSIKH